MITVCKSTISAKQCCERRDLLVFGNTTISSCRNSSSKPDCLAFRISCEAWLLSGKYKYFALLSMSNFANPHVSATAMKRLQNITKNGFCDIYMADFSNSFSRSITKHCCSHAQYCKHPAPTLGPTRSSVRHSTCVSRLKGKDEICTI